MRKRSNTENASARADGGFNRVAALVRASAEFTRLTDRFAKIARPQIQIEASALVPRIGSRPEMKSNGSKSQAGSESPREDNRDGARESSPQSMRADAIDAIDGFATKLKAIDAMTRVRENVLVGKATKPASLASSISSHSKLSRESSSRESLWREDTTGSSRSGFARMVEQSSLGRNALTRMHNSQRRFSLSNDSNFNGVPRLEEPNGPSWGGLAGRAKRLLEGVGSFSIGSEEGSRRSVGKYVAASRAARSSMVAPASFSRPEFAEAMRGVYGQESRNAPGSITINSTPTIVINASEASGDVERQVVGALRAHRDELFDQFKRESVRRERAEF